MNLCVMAAAILFPVALLTHPATSSFAQTPTSPTLAPGGNTGLTGIITVRPAHPHSGLTGQDINTPDIAPLSNCAFTVQSDKGTTLTSFTTDAEGHFQVSLPPGRYIIALKDEQKRAAHLCGSFVADVLAGKMTAVQWLCESGSSAR